MCWVWWEPKTWALEQTPALTLCCHLRCAALGKYHDLSVPQLRFCKTEPTAHLQDCCTAYMSEYVQSTRTVLGVYSS